MGITDTLRRNLVNWLMPEYSERAAMLRVYATRRDYREGLQRRPLVVKADQADDNIVLNFTGLIVDRGISMLVGQGVTFDFGEDDEGNPDQRADYIAAVQNANTYPIYLHKLAQLGGTYGTAYTKIMPDALPNGLPRLVALNPQWVTMESATDDLETVYRYVIEYNTFDDDGKEVAHREVTERNQTADSWADSWSVTTYVMRSVDIGKWVKVSEVQWPYEFGPIVHWQNLPDAEQTYGDPDITDDMIVIQDAINFVGSNVQRIIRYHAHPKTWGKGFSTSGTASWGADEMVTINGDGMISNLEMQSDLLSSREFLHYLRGILFDISRTVDLASMTDKIGALTNFALRVLYKDALDKLETKRLLYGWGLTEINRRVLLLAGIATEDGGEVVWPDPLPLNSMEQAQEVQIDLGMGVVDTQTASIKRGYDWEQVEERKAEEAQGETNLGNEILRTFEQGLGAE